MKILSGSAILRVRVFVLADGTSVVQWDEKRVQELLSGQYRHYDHQRDFGHAITDYELNILKSNGRVEHYTQKFVWLFPLPEAGRYQRKVLDGLSKTRGYYLTTGCQKMSYRQFGKRSRLLDYKTLCGQACGAMRLSSIIRMANCFLKSKVLNMRSKSC